jgi:hypothetical protein
MVVDAEIVSPCDVLGFVWGLELLGLCQFILGGPSQLVDRG